MKHLAQIALILVCSLQTVAAQNKTSVTLKPALRDQIQIAVDAAKNQCPIQLSKDISMQNIFFNEMTIGVNYSFTKDKIEIMTIDTTSLKKTAVDMLFADEYIGNLADQLTMLGIKFQISLFCAGHKKNIYITQTEIEEGKKRHEKENPLKQLTSVVNYINSLAPFDINDNITVWHISIENEKIVCPMRVNAGFTEEEDIFALASVNLQKAQQQAIKAITNDDAMKILIGYCHATKRSFKVTLLEKGTKRRFEIEI